MQRDDYSWRAEATLDRVEFAHLFLQRGQAGWRRHPFDRYDITPLNLYREHETRTYSFAVDDRCACSAYALLAAKVRAG